MDEESGKKKKNLRFSLSKMIGGVCELNWFEQQKGVTEVLYSFYSPFTMPTGLLPAAGLYNLLCGEHRG